MIEEKERIQQAQKSLELERVINRMKRDNYRQELDQCLQYKQQKVSHNQGVNSQVVQQDLQNIQMYAQKELSNIAAYRSKLQQKDDIIR